MSVDVNARTPGASPDFESCIRTLMVSSGWQASCSPPFQQRPFSFPQQSTHRLHCARETSSGDVRRESDWFLVALGFGHGSLEV